MTYSRRTSPGRLMYPLLSPSNTNYDSPFASFNHHSYQSHQPQFENTNYGCDQWHGYEQHQERPLHLKLNMSVHMSPYLTPSVHPGGHHFHPGQEDHSLHQNSHNHSQFMPHQTPQHVFDLHQNHIDHQQQLRNDMEASQYAEIKKPYHKVNNHCGVDIGIEREVRKEKCLTDLDASLEDRQKTSTNTFLGHHKEQQGTIWQNNRKRQQPLSDHSCPQCHKQYCRKSTLNAHLRQHNGEKPFHCQVCGKEFSQAANLSAHKRVHTGEKPFWCPICLRMFSQSSSLVTHKRIHTGERPYVCNHCQKSFTDSSTLTKHRRTHTGQKPYECLICMMSFTQSGNLHRHMKTHRRECRR